MGGGRGAQIWRGAALDVSTHCRTTSGRLEHPMRGVKNDRAAGIARRRVQKRGGGASRARKLGRNRVGKAAPHASRSWKGSGRRAGGMQSRGNGSSEETEIVDSAQTPGDYQDLSIESVCKGGGGVRASAEARSATAFLCGSKKRPVRVWTETVGRRSSSEM